MATAFTEDISKGTDLSVDNFLIRIFRSAMLRDYNVDTYSKEEIIKVLKEIASVSNMEEFAGLKERIKLVEEFFESLPHATVVDVENVQPEPEISHIIPSKLIKPIEEKYKPELLRLTDQIETNPDNAKETMLQHFKLSAQRDAEVAIKKLAYLKRLSAEEQKKIYSKYINSTIANYEASIRNQKIIASRYKKMKAIVEKWQVTDKLQSLKDYALDQLDMGIKYESPSAYAEQTLEKLKKGTISPKQYFESQITQNEEALNKAMQDIQKINDQTKK